MHATNDVDILENQKPDEVYQRKIIYTFPAAQVS